MCLFHKWQYVSLEHRFCKKCHKMQCGVYFKHVAWSPHFTKHEMMGWKNIKRRNDFIFQLFLYDKDILENTGFNSERKQEKLNAKRNLARKNPNEFKRLENVMKKFGW